ncbi:MAG TPA: IS1182 family transposase [Acidimicrobiales bacterium]|nr:IS1182 family transposase [Acidimicrobiales bacterium]
MQGANDPNRALLDAAALCGHLVPAGSVPAFLAEHRHRLFPDELFADLFPSGRGRPSVPGDVVATVMVLQSLEGLSDRDAITQLRTNIAWKVACGLPLDDRGFHPTVLTLWRNKLRASERPERIFEVVRQVIDECGVLADRSRRALDSTVLDDAVVRQDAVMQLVTQIRRVRRLVPEARALALEAHDYDTDPGKPACAWDDDEAIDAMVSALVRDALATLSVTDSLVLDQSQAEAVGLLALVAGQDVEPGEDEGTWRIAQKTRPDRMVSVVDPESRHVHKTNHNYRDGYKAHVAVEPETGLVTSCALTPGNAPDGPAGLALLEGDEPDLEVIADSAYGSGETRASLRAAGHRQVIKPIVLRTAVPGGFDRSDFTVDLEDRTVTCPNNVTVRITDNNNACFGVACLACDLRSRCTTARRGRLFKIHPHEAELIEARRRAHDADYLETYRQWRPMVERTIAWLVANGSRKVRYRGVERNQLGLSMRVAAINLRRLIRLGLDYDPGGWVLTT